MFLRCDDSCFIPLFLSFCLVRCFFFLLSGSSFLQGLFSSCGVPFSHHGVLSCCRAQALRHGDFSSCGSQALEHRLNSCGAWGWLLQGMWDLPGSGIELLFPALTGGFLTTEPLEKPWCGFEETLYVSLCCLGGVCLMSCMCIYRTVNHRWEGGKEQNSDHSPCALCSDFLFSESSSSCSTLFFPSSSVLLSTFLINNLKLF